MSENKGLMFDFVGPRFNLVTGCLHECYVSNSNSYGCWARKLALTKLKHQGRYQEGFIPHFNPSEVKKLEKQLNRLQKLITAGKIVKRYVFVTSMGDIFSPGVLDEWVDSVFWHIRNYQRDYPDIKFLILTKNPTRYWEFIEDIPDNCILAATVETNRPYSGNFVSKAPEPSHRLRVMTMLNEIWDGEKAIIIEPIVKFDLKQFSELLYDISPNFVVIGKDNHHCSLPEPSFDEIQQLKDRLDNFTNVILKGELVKLLK